MKLCNVENCTGCGACLNACGHNAICFSEDSQGFLCPVINDKKCVNCGSCKRACPVINPVEAYEHIQVYAALVKNDAERMKSTSGGIFTCLAKQFVQTGGVVYGAVLNDDLSVKHIEVDSLEAVDSKIRGSKYVQSDIGLCYKQAKNRLKEGKKVLFSGTPCQIAGLRSFLQKDYDSLTTVDILCHGVPSPGLFRKYIQSEESAASSKMCDIQFRSKGIGWKKLLTDRFFENGEKADWGDTFVPGFLKNYYLRESCYSCKYCTVNRQGDITLGDYWGYQESAPDYIEDDDKGISLVIINTDKGKKAFRSIRKKIAVAERTIEDAKRKNAVLYKPCDKPDDYCAFWSDEKTMDWSELSNKYFKEQDRSDWMSKELREYYDIPFEERHSKHKFRCNVNEVKRKIKKIGGK